VNDRVTRLREKMEEVDLQGFLVGAPAEDIFHTLAANRRYISGFSGSMGWALITPAKAFMAVDFRYVEQAGRECEGFNVYQTTGGMERWFADLVGLAGLSGKRIAFEPSEMTVAHLQAFRKSLASMPEDDRPKLLSSPPLVTNLRAIKELGEIEKLQRAVDVGDAAFEYVAARIEPGWTEKKIAWEIEKHARENGAEALSFPTIVAAGAHGAMPHAQPRDVHVKARDALVIDMGVVVDGYCSDLTRTVCVGGEPDDEFKKIYDIVLTAQRTAEEIVQAGMTGEEAHMLAHNVIEEAGYGEKFGHGLGHGVGMLVHEAPRLAKLSKDQMQDGMVATIEPGIYIPGWGGVRIEDMVYFDAGKAKVMSHAAKLAL
jgi:Xaa-Pro aminopeptidase